MRTDNDYGIGPDVWALAELCSQAILQGQTLDDWLARMEVGLDDHFPPPPEGELLRDPDLRRRLLRVILRGIWKQTPQPTLNYALPKVPQPKRNERCHCGSGRKYKQCCQPLERGLPHLKANFLPSLLAALPRKRWAELAGSKIDRDMVGDTVCQWAEEDELELIAALLQPWFADDSAFVGRNEFLFDTLVNAYEDLGKPRKKTRLLDRAEQGGDRILRSAAKQRKASALADQDKLAEAWALFNEAQRLDPESPSLSYLEVTMLLAEGEEEQARSRAEFWARKLAKRPGSDQQHLVDLLLDIAQRGMDAVHQQMSSISPIGLILSAMDNAPPVASAYRLDPYEGSAGPLEADPALAVALRGLREQIEPGDFFPGSSRARDSADAQLLTMLELLDQYPELWNCFEVLSEMAYTINELDPGDLKAPLVLPLLERAELLLEEVLEANQAQGCRLEWSHWANRSALDLLAWRIGLDLAEPATPDHIQRLERILKLNPNDNQGMRMPLSRRYLEADRFEDALRLADQHPDDLPEMSYNRVLALYALGHVEKAEKRLQELAGKYPKILDALLKHRIPRPKIDPQGVRLGGDDEAWLYRQDYRETWERLGALKRAASCAR